MTFRVDLAFKSPYISSKIMDDSYLLVNWRKVERMAYLRNHVTFLYVV